MILVTEAARVQVHDPLRLRVLVHEPLCILMRDFLSKDAINDKS
jgi:hypothetical protein